MHSVPESTSDTCPKLRNARRIIDEKIAEFEDSIRQLKSRRNSLTPISQLPPEIFGRIFAFTAAAVREVSYTRPASWFAFSHVSHLWRAIALETPDLWSTPTFRYSKWTAAMLERCKTADLTIRNSFSGGYEAESLKNLLENHLSHTREIDISVVQATNAVALFDALPAQAPRLNKLRIHAVPPHQVNLPESLFAEATQLRHLDLSGCDCKWSSRLFRGLTHLKINNTSTRPTITEFLVALQQIPELETLNLQTVLPLLVHPTPDVSGLTVALPHLQSLRLSSPIGEISQVIGFLTIPNTTIVEIESMTITEESLHDGLISWLSSSEKGADTPYRSLSVSCYGVDLAVKFWKNAAKDRYVDTCNLGIPKFSLKLRLHVGKAENALLRMFTLLQPRDITALELNCSNISDSFLAKTFGKFPLLERVHVGNDNGGYHFLKALAYKFEDYQTSQLPYDRRVAFSALRCLSLEEVKFDGDYADSIRIDSLRDILMERCEENAGLEKLTISDCYYFDSSTLKLMEEIVVDVVWDEVEQDYEEEEDEEDEDELGEDYLSNGYYNSDDD